MKRRFFNTYQLTIIDRLMIVLIIVGLLGMVNLKMADRAFSTPILAYAEKQVNKLATLLINKAVMLQVEENVEPNEIITASKTDEGVINTIDFNTYLINSVSTNTINQIYEYLNLLETGAINELNTALGYSQDYGEGLIYEIPFGVLSNNSLLTSVGPKIPVRYEVAGDVIGNLKSEITEYGINNALIKIFIEITVSIDVIIPLAYKGCEVSMQVPIAMQMIQGSIPNTYLGVKSLS